MAPVIPVEVLVAIAVAIFTFIFIAIRATKGDYRSELVGARKALRKMINEKNAIPIMIRLAWHDSGTYDVSKKGKLFAETGGANGSIRFEPEIKHGANAGLSKALTYLEPIKAQFPKVTWADLIQMASAESIALAGGPTIPMKYGRTDTQTPDECPKEGNLPGAAGPFADNTPDAAAHLRKVFYRMGFNDRDIVALSGAHTVGRAFKERSGTTPHGYGEKGATKFTCPAFRARADGAEGVGMAGGQSWTEKWLKFDNSYFTCERSPELLRLETDIALETCPGFAPHFKRYKESEQAFFEDYADVHKRLSELGSVFSPPGGITI